MRVPILTALYQRLNGHVPAPVYSNVPEGTAPPYVAIGEGTFTTLDTDDSRGGEAVIEVQTWTSNKSRNGGMAGFKQASEISDAIRSRLHEQYLSAEGYSIAFAIHNDSASFDEPDGKTKRVVDTYRIVFHE